MKTLTDTEMNEVLSWFSGKSKDRAQNALGLINRSILAGGWLPGASRTVKAALGKANVAATIARKNEKALNAINHYMVNGQYDKAIADAPRNQRGWELAHNMTYSTWTGRAAALDFAAIRAGVPRAAAETGVSVEHLMAVVARGERYGKAFVPVAAVITKLDATRPQPVFTKLGVSPTVTATLKGLGMAVRDADSIAVCSIVWEEVETEGKFRKVGRLVWPAGTIHNQSPHGKNGQFFCCEACGHAIKNPFNWVPLVITATDGTIYSLMVGRDCSRNLFGIEVTGEVELQEVSAAK